jgi:arylsulfatase A-like enzyme
MKSKLYEPLLLAGLAAACAVPVSPVGAAEAPRPNILFILADDLGWGDVSFHGGDIQTPNIDKLAASGARLEQFYVQPLCTPTRSSLMTGRYPMRQGLQWGVIKPQAQYGLPLDERTLPQALKEAGYFTAIDGKWHQGHFQKAYLPMERGFDSQYGHYNGAIDYFTHLRDGGLDWHRNEHALVEKGYSTHLIALEAMRIIRERDPRKPFFLYVAFNAVHNPLEVPESYTLPYSHFPARRRTYAGMVAALDEAVGQILDTLDREGLRKNTLIIFSSDNGGLNPGVISSNGPLRGQKGMVYEGGIRVPACAAWEGRIPAGSTVTALLHIVDWYPTLLKLAGADPHQPKPLDGLDAWGAIAHSQPSPHSFILHNASPYNGALREGDWKLVINGYLRDNGEDAQSMLSKGAQMKGDVVELFNIASDPFEKTDLAKQEPARVKELRALYGRLAKEAVRQKTEPPSPDFKTPKVWGEF